MSEQTMMWAAFGVLMVVMLAIDLGMNRTAHTVSFRQALTWSIIWVSLALIFNVGIYTFLGKTKALEFFTGYIIEKSLSVDNLFVFIMIFVVFPDHLGHYPLQHVAWFLPCRARKRCQQHCGLLPQNHRC